MEVINIDKMSLVELESLGYKLIEKRELVDRELGQVGALIQEKRNEHRKTAGNIAGAKEEIKNPSQKIEKEN